MAFVHLHVHSEYSMLDGLGPVKQIAEHAKALGHGAVALTDHGVMYGAIEFFDACHDNGVKPIIGMEGYMTKRGRRMQDRDINFDKQPYHMLMLAMNNTGYKNLMRMASLAQLEGFYYRPRIDHTLLETCNEGIICTSGCLASEIPRLIMAGQIEDARNAAKWYRDLFDDRFYFELQEHELEECRTVNKMLVNWAQELSIPLIATSDAHYLKREDAIPHDLMLCIQTTALLSQKDRMRFNNDSYYMHTEDEMRGMFDAIAPEAVSTTAVIAERCSVSLKTKNFYLPNYRSPVQFDNDDAYLSYLCKIGFEVRYGIPANDDGKWVTDDANTATHEGGMPLALIEKAKKLSKSVFTDDDTPIKLTKLSPLALSSADSNPAMSPRRLRERLAFELKTIISMGFSKYMLIVWDLIRFCRESGIWWDVRGSAAGSVVSHVLMLTNIEPVSNDLFFERFLNPERVTMPDIDMDFPDDQRHLLVDYTIEKYGKENVAQIITFGTMAARGALKDVGRVMDVPLSEVNRVTSLVPAIPGKPVTLKQAREEVQALKDLLLAEPRLNEMYEKAITIEGRVRNAGTHAAGVVIADKPLIEYVPLNRLTGTALTPQLKAVTQFEMGHLEAIGLLKMDYLGLSMLTIIRRAAEMVARRHSVSLDMNTIPIHEKSIFDLLSRGDVLGVFQVEGAGMKKLMTEMRPTRFENIVAAISLFRPGPLEYIPTYIRRMHGEEEIKYHHPDLEGALGETYGILVYQEQLMRVARDFAGYSMGEADTIRKAVSKKQADALAKHKTKFRDGAVQKGYKAETADAIWADIEYFARYGFNKSHAAIYASITCQTAWLKANYPTEYLTALMTAEAGSTEKIAMLIADAKAHGIDTLPPSVNWSMADFDIDESHHKLGVSPKPHAQLQSSGIRFGMSAIKNVGTGPIEAILKARYATDDLTDIANRKATLKNKPFRNLDDFCRRIDMTQFNKKSLESLIKVGALDEFGPRPQLLAVVDQMIGQASAERKAAEKGQNMLFAMFGGEGDADDETELIVLPKKYTDYSKREMLTWEKELIGTYVSDHPLTAALANLKDTITHTANHLDETAHQHLVVVAGVIQSIRPHTSKAGRPMAFGVLEDLTGIIELTIFPKAYEAHQSLLAVDKVVVIYGKAETREGRGAQILVDKVTDSVNVSRSTDQLWRANTFFEDLPPAPPPAPNVDDHLIVSAVNPSDDDLVEPDGFWQSDATYDDARVKTTAYVNVAGGNEKHVSEAVEEYVGNGQWSVTTMATQTMVAAQSAELIEPTIDIAASPLVLLNHQISESVILPDVLPPADLAQIRAESQNHTIDIDTDREVELLYTPATPVNNTLLEDALHPNSLPPTSIAQQQILRQPNGIVQVIICRSGNVNNDIERLQAVHSTLLLFQGDQQFSIRLKNGGAKDMVIDFPNDGIRDCDELRMALRAIGAECDD
jgi:DNA polymerase-3 subunit alpha